MNISQENIDALNAVVTIEFDKADYQPKADKALKEQAKRVNIKGFRPGHAPVAMVKKMYGTQVLVETINQLVGEALSNHISDNKLDILGEPLPNADQQPIDFDKEFDKISFKFDLGLSPEVAVNVDKALKVPAYTITVDDKSIDEQVSNITSRFGAQAPVEVSSEKSMLKGAIELGENKNENGITSVEVIKDEAQKALFVGKKVGDVVEFDIRKTFAEDSEVAYLLGIEKEQAAAIAEGSMAKMTISEVSEFKAAEVNADLFKKVFPKEDITEEAAFRTKVAEQLTNSNAFAQEYRFSVDARKSLMAAAGDIQLPEEFLKRWLTAVNKDNEKFTPEVLVNEFPKFAEDLKWQVVKNRVARANDLKLANEDMLAFAKKSVRMQFMQYGLTDIPEENLVEYASNMLKNKEQISHIAEGALEDKIVAFVKENAEVEAKTVSQEEFGKLFEADK